MKKGIRSFALAVLWLALGAPLVSARDIEPVVLPPGALLHVYTAEEANDILIAQGRNTSTTKSWDEGGSVSQVRTTQVEHYVRVFAYDDTRLKGGAVGSWTMRASSLRGMTAQQIKEVFALPSLPNYVTCVRVPVGTSLWTGTAGAIPGWGEGGAQQMMLVDRIDAANYTYQRALGANALWYAPQVADNPYRVGGYLDRLPKAKPYSDQEYVFNMLDYLATGPLASALEQMGPSRYDALSRLALAETAGIHQAIAARSRRPRAQQPGPDLWASLLGSVGRQADSGGLMGWRYWISTLLVGLDYANSQNLLWGLTLGLASSDLSFEGGLGDARRTTPLLSLYTGWSPQPWDLSLSLTGGPTSASMKRNLVFSELSRTATGRPDGYMLGLGLSAGYTLPLKAWVLRPQAGLDLLRYHQRSLAEDGAETLNLKLDDYTASHARTSLGVILSRPFTTAGGLSLTPSVGLAWTYTAPLDSHSLTSSFSGQPGSFSVQGDTRSRHGISPTLSLSLASGPALSLALSYAGEIREDLLAHSLDLSAVWRF